MWALIFYPLFGIAMSLTIGLIYYGQSRAEKRLPLEGEIRTRPSFFLKAFFLGFGIVFFAVGVGVSVMLSIKDDVDTGQIIAVGTIFPAMSLVGFFGYAYVRFNYVVSADEGIVAHRLLRKTKFYRYDEVSAFKDTVSLGMYGGLVGYGVNGKKIFAIEAVSIGAKAVADRLREKGVRPLPVYRKPHV